MSKYTIKPSDLERQGGAKKLERDGFTKEQIMKTMYKQTEGASKEYRTRLVSKLYDRREDC